eukprot:TRINITY_DN2853_c3_g1_i1.p1 TRINITY_DN2853_c3_g1~~TRINITY_DN2853_c3_g1_i1.p1  ORF type:complete len:382 (+),score=64.57 TRINITY_DN2853_c3_g1_i1:71-1216(+)
MYIYCRSIDGSTHAVEVSDNATVGQLRMEISDFVCIDEDDLCLRMCGVEVLNDISVPLSNSGIRNDDIIEVDMSKKKAAVRKLKNLNVDEGNTSELINAANAGNQELVKLLLLSGANPSGEVNSMTPLIAAVRGGNSGVIELLLAFGASASQSTEKSCPLLEGCIAGSVSNVTFLIQAGAMNCRRYLAPSFIRAARDGHEAIIKIFLSNGVRAKSKIARQGLRRAALANQFHIVRLLIEVGVKADCKEAASTMVKLCADGSTTSVAAMLELGVPADIIHQSSTPLLAASQHGHFEVVDLLLAAGAQPNIKPETRFGKAKSTTAVKAAFEKNHPKVVDILLKHGAHLDIGKKSNDSIKSEGSEELFRIVKRHNKNEQCCIIC